MLRGLFKIVTSVIAFLLCLSVIRSLLGAKPLTLTGLLELLSDVDVDFNSTLGLIAKIGHDFSFTNSSLIDAIKHFFTGVYDLLCLPIGFLMDISSFCTSVISFLVRLLGFDVFGLSFSPGDRPIPEGPLSPGFGDGFGGGGFGGGGGRGT